MIAEVISIGDELTSGQRLDTNSQWLSTQLGEIGVRTLFHTTVGDDLASNIDVFRIAAGRADIVVSTGGLGPTADDLTREALADAFGCPLECNEEALKHVEGLFQKRKRPMPERNRVQAMFPKGARTIHNPHGTAPGIDMQVAGDVKDSRIFALPGVPSEMKQMWEQTVLTRLREELGVGKRKLYYRTVKLFGIGESDVEAKMPELISRQRYPRVGITVSQATISLRIVTEAASELESREQLSETEREIQEALGDLIFGSGEMELQNAVCELLDQRQQSLCLVEIGAASVAQSWLAHADDGLGRFRGGWHWSSLEQALSSENVSGSMRSSIVDWRRRLERHLLPIGVWSLGSILGQVLFDRLPVFRRLGSRLRWSGLLKSIGTNR